MPRTWRVSNLPPVSQGNLKALVDVIRNEVGNDQELVKQAVAEYFALDRQNLRDHCEGRLEYARHVMSQRDASLRGIVEYGLQTLKWSFLLNAGAIAVVMAYIGAAIGKSGAAISAYTSIVTELWPFAAGCALVAMAGITAFFNFSYAEATLPSVEALNSFLWRGSTKWPLGRFQKPDESPEAFMKRFGRKVVWSRSLAIIFGSGSIIAFALGVLFLMRAVVTFW